MGPLGELGALFNPGMRHEIEEELTKKMLREEEGTGRKGRLGIDLDSGVVTIAGEDDPGDDAPEGSDSPAAEDSESPSADSSSDNRSSAREHSSARDHSASNNRQSTRTNSAPSASDTGPTTRNGSAVPSGKRHRRR